MLADKDLSILALLRLVPEGPDQEELRVGLKYSLKNRQNYGGVPILTPVGLWSSFCLYQDVPSASTAEICLAT